MKLFKLSTFFTLLIVGVSIFFTSPVLADDVVINSVTLTDCPSYLAVYPAGNGALTGLTRDVVVYGRTAYNQIWCDAFHNSQLVLNGGTIGIQQYTSTSSWPEFWSSNALAMKNFVPQYRWNGSTWATTTTNAQISGPLFYNNFYSNYNISYNGTTQSYNSSYTDIDYDPFSTGDIVYYAPVTDFPQIPPSPSTFAFSITYDVILGTSVNRIKLETPVQCTIDITDPDNTSYTFSGCDVTDSANYSLMTFNSTEMKWYPVEPFATGIRPPVLPTPDAPEDYCSKIVDSNYNLKTIDGTMLCQASSNPYLEGLIPAKDVIDWDAPTEDWGIDGIFNFLKDPLEFLLDGIDSIFNAFIDLYVGFMSFIIPNPNDFDYFFSVARTTAQENLPDVNLDGVENFADLNASEMTPLTVSFHGSTVPLIDFKLFTDVYSSIQPIAMAIFGMALIWFNINQINKLLADNNAV